MTTENQVLPTTTKHFYPDPVPHSVMQSWLFADLLPWQHTAWAYMTEHFPNLPHAMLFAGNAGTGKRAFVYRFVAWALCHAKTINHQGVATACGECPSCQWLMAHTHPNLYQIPPINIASESSDITKPNSKSKAKLSDQSPTHAHSAIIKIDTIRELQPFVQQSSDGIRLVVIHQADLMTLGASNALLKTLEEPAENVLMLLISDTPSQLLPTIRSRLQSMAVSQLTPQQSLEFMQAQLQQDLTQGIANQYQHQNGDSAEPNLQDLTQVNALSGYAPFVALDMWQSQWYQHRQTWINSWQALRSHQRSPVQASDYWQKTLSLTDFLYLSQLMLVEIANHLSNLMVSQQDLDYQKLNPRSTLSAILQLQQLIRQIVQDRRQHIQDKLCYDKLMYALQQS
ncbi:MULTISPECIES: DNA-directed DNA polymerase [unclassified Moraxella]|uniref:DNA-directed DNA polymerase n=1 Tax=unclassified Moraxella TaxID=2685852 RepID=UPI003AF49E4F